MVEFLEGPQSASQVGADVRGRDQICRQTSRPGGFSQRLRGSRLFRKDNLCEFLTIWLLLCFRE